MSEPEFVKMVVEEAKIRSFMTMRFSKRQLKRFKKWFFRKGKKRFQWNPDRCQREWDHFLKAFNIQIESNEKS